MFIYTIFTYLNINKNIQYLYMPSKAKATKPKIVKIKIIEPVLVNDLDKVIQVPDISYSVLPPLESIALPPSLVEVEPMPCVCDNDNAKLTILELRKLCKERGIKGYSKLKKQDLLNLLV